MPERGVLLARHQTATERAEEREARRVAAAYRKARQEILDRLFSQWTGAETLTPAQAADLVRRLGLLQQIDARLQALEQELGVIVRGIVTASSEQAIEQIRQQLALLPAEMRPEHLLTFAQINTRMVERFVPVAFNDMQLGTRALSLQLQRELQTGLLQGEGFDVLVRRLMAATPTGTGQPVWRNGEVSAERAIRRTVITAENSAKNEAIAEVERQIPEVKKQAIAAIGPTTTDCCLRVHGQIVGVNEPFVLTGTPRFADRMMAPSFHWNCRTSVAMYHPLFEQGGLTTASMVKSAQAEIKKRDGKGGTI